MRSTKTLSLLIIVIFFGSLSLYAIKFPVISYKTSDGLPQSVVNTLIQDQLGYILAGTQSGIGKFDGNSFQVISKKDGLPNSYINHLEKDNLDHIWVATTQGLARLNTNKNYQISVYLKNTDVLFLCFEQRSNTLWIITRSGVYYIKNGSPVNYKVLNSKYDEDADQHIKGILINSTGEKYFYSDNQITIVNNDQISNTISVPGDISINCMKLLNKKIIVGTNSGVFQLENQQIRKYIDLPAGYTNVTDAISDSQNRTWIGTEQGLLFYSNINVPSDVTILNDKNGLPTAAVRSILIDREKNVILGTDWGLAQITPNLFKMYDETDGLPHKYTWSFTELKDTILVSCNNGIVSLDTKTGKLKPLSTLNQKLKGYSVRAVINLNQKEFILCTRENGIFKWYPAENDRLERINKARVLCAIKSPDNTIWFGTDNGILHYDGTRFQSIKDGLRSKYVWTLAIVDSNTLLVGTDNGVQKYYKGKFVPCTLESVIKKNTVINDIKVISPNEILVATELYGLFIFKNKQVKNLTTENGLLSNDIWSVIKDDMGNIWFTTTLSLDRYTDGFISHFNKKTGLFGDEGAIHSIFKSKSGKLYIGITPGFIEIPVFEADLEINKPLLYIKKIKVGNKEFSPDETIRLKHNETNIEFEYIAVSTRKENPIYYKTRLNPLEKQWTEATRDTYTKYRTLSPDDYLFEVTANNGGGDKQWFKSLNSINFVIEKPFWEKPWFILLMVIIVILLVFAIIKIRLNALERQKKILEKLVKKRTEELGEKNKELQYLSITDPLTDLKNRRYLEEKIKEDVGLIERFMYDQTKNPDKQPLGAPILGVFILDIDYFKKVNDKYGHKAGDIVIVDIARILIEMLRNSDTIVRWGGEEFLIITRQYEKIISFDLAERIRKKIASYPFVIDEHITIHKTVSVGFAHFPFIPNDIKKVNWTHVVSLADSALYTAKNNGRNMTVGIEIGERELDIDFKEIVSDIKMGIDKKYLKLISQKEHLTICQHKT